MSSRHYLHQIVSPNLKSNITSAQQYPIVTLPRTMSLRGENLLTKNIQGLHYCEQRTED